METNAQELERRIEALEMVVRILVDLIEEWLPPERARVCIETIGKQKVGDE